MHDEFVVGVEFLRARAGEWFGLVVRSPFVVAAVCFLFLWILVLVSRVVFLNVFLFSSRLSSDDVSGAKVGVLLLRLGGRGIVEPPGDGDLGGGDGDL